MRILGLCHNAGRVDGGCITQSGPDPSSARVTGCGSASAATFTASVGHPFAALLIALAAMLRWV